MRQQMAERLVNGESRVSIGGVFVRISGDEFNTTETLPNGVENPFMTGQSMRDVVVDERSGMATTGPWLGKIKWGLSALIRSNC